MTYTACTDVAGIFLLAVNRKHLSLLIHRAFDLSLPSNSYEFASPAADNSPSPTTRGKRRYSCNVQTQKRIRKEEEK